MKNPLDSRQLSAFISLAQTGNLTETGRQLSLTHSAISHTIKNLEYDAGCRLFARVGKRVLLTEAGEALLRHARHIFGEMEKARQTLHRLNTWTTPRLRLRADVALTSFFLPEVIARLAAKNKGVRISIEFGLADAQSQENGEGHAELFLGPVAPLNQGFVSIPIYEEHLCIVLPAGHRWLAGPRVSILELVKKPCGLLDKSSALRALIDRVFERENSTPNLQLECGSIETLKAFVRSGCGFTVLPGSAVRGELERKELAALPFRFQGAKISWALHHPREKPLTPIESEFLSECERFARTNPGPWPETGGQT
jgi:DNA-binding transcriptional LysR family regulator